MLTHQGAKQTKIKKSANNFAIFRERGLFHDAEMLFDKHNRALQLHSLNDLAQLLAVPQCLLLQLLRRHCPTPFVIPPTYPSAPP